jgi:hypothetical protein
MLSPIHAESCLQTEGPVRAVRRVHPACVLVDPARPVLMGCVVHLACRPMDAHESAAVMCALLLTGLAPVPSPLRAGCPLYQPHPEQVGSPSAHGVRPTGSPPRAAAQLLQWRLYQPPLHSCFLIPYCTSMATVQPPAASAFLRSLPPHDAQAALRVSAAM